MLSFFISILAKTVSAISRFFGFGMGVTWAGEISIILDKDIVRRLSADLKNGVVLVSGTNGKTTTSKMIGQILQSAGKSVIHSHTGANLENGIAGTLILNTDISGKLKKDYAILEVDEAILPRILESVNFKVLVLLNLFRDQLDRYGEINTIAKKWIEALKKIDNKDSFLVVNSDDPLVKYVSGFFDGKIKYFGLNKISRTNIHLSHAVDSSFCPKCGYKLMYRQVYLSHYGNWECPKCDMKRGEVDLSEVKSSLGGIYNTYNSLAAVLSAQNLDVSIRIAQKALLSFKPAFGRQEELVYKGKRVKIYLSKNPAGFNASLQAVLERSPKTLLLALNDRIPDGRDVSWIWDVDFEVIPDRLNLFITGDRALDLGLRLKYTRRDKDEYPVTGGPALFIKTELKNALDESIKTVNKNDFLYILPTYSAMLNLREIILGKKL